MRQFLDELERRGPRAYHCFLEALKDQHLHLHSTLVRSCTENDMRKYVSFNDLHKGRSRSGSMGSMRSRAGSNASASSKAPREQSVSGTGDLNGAAGSNSAVPKKLSLDSKQGDATGKKKGGYSKENVHRSTDLATIRTTADAQLVSAPESLLLENGYALPRNGPHTSSGRRTHFTVAASVLSIVLWVACMLRDYLFRVGAALLNFDSNFKMPSANQEVIRLERGDNVFVYNPQPAWAIQEDRALAVNKYGKCVLLPKDSFKNCDDPRGEEWFFPRDGGDRPVLNETQLYAILEGQPCGTFVVYRPQFLQQVPQEGCRHVYKLSVCYEHTFLTYPIFEYNNGQVGFSDKERYANICCLVTHHGLNRGSIAVRLRLPYSRRKFNIEDHLPAGCRRVTLSHPGGEIIGIGYASEVKRVRDQDDNRVALKVPRQSDVDSELVQLDFLEEVKHMLSFSHENVVRSVGVYLADGLTHIVMEYLPNGDLQHCLLQGKLRSADTPAMVEVCVQTLSALAYLKQKRVIHRDVAARNVLVARTQPMHVKLTDFGMSRFVRTDVYMAEKNEVMALRWAAPEVFSRLHYSSKSDVWAVGMFLFEVFSSGQEPYNTIPDDQVLDAVVDKKKVPEQPECCPTGLYALMMHCWKFDPAERPGVDGLLRCVRRNCRTSPPEAPTSLAADLKEVRCAQSDSAGKGSRLENLYTLDSGPASGSPSGQRKVGPPSGQRKETKNQGTKKKKTAKDGDSRHCNTKKQR